MHTYSNLTSNILLAKALSSFKTLNTPGSTAYFYVCFGHIPYEITAVIITIIVEYPSCIMCLVVFFFCFFYGFACYVYVSLICCETINLPAWITESCHQRWPIQRCSDSQSGGESSSSAFSLGLSLLLFITEILLANADVPRSERQCLSVCVLLM